MIHHHFWIVLLSVIVWTVVFWAIWGVVARFFRRCQKPGCPSGATACVRVHSGDAVIRKLYYCEEHADELIRNFLASVSSNASIVEDPQRKNTLWVLDGGTDDAR